ncbi:MAG: DNA translocase FtsK [Ruminiclostridium sp.]|nr:DNA translocase FtsK [Ruminiclostridium sp.]
MAAKRNINADTAKDTEKTTTKKRSNASDKKQQEYLERRRKELEKQQRSKRRRSSIILFAIGVLLVLFTIIGLIGGMGRSEGDSLNMLDMIYSFLCGVFGFTVFFTGPIVIYVAVLIATDKSRTSILTKVLQLTGGIIILSTAIQIIFVGSVGKGTTDFFGAIGSLYSDGVNLVGGGIIGGLPAWVLLMFGNAGAIVMIILIAFVFVMLISRKSLMDFLGAVGKPVKKAAVTAKEKHAQHKEEMEALRREQEQLRLQAESENKERLAQLEMNTVGSEKTTLKDRQKENIKEQKKDSDNFINELKNYNGIVSPKPDEAVQQSSETLPDIAPESDIHTSCEKLPDLPAMTDKNADNVADNVDHEKQEISANTESKDTAFVTSDSADEYPPLPDYPPEEVNPVEAALNSFIEETNGEQEAIRQREEQFANDVSVPVSEPVETVVAETDGDNAVDEQADESDSGEKLYTVTIDPDNHPLPPTALLDEIMPGKAQEDIDRELETNANTIVEALRSFGVQTKCIGTCRGPSVTRYELQPAAGVKISKITGLADDIALNLAASGIRIEAPIPNKPAVGIEVPNKIRDTVPFRQLIESDEIAEKKSKLAAVLGKDISGEIVIADIAEMPHLLIAGTTGSGKSVCVNSIIMSILFRSKPEEVRFIMIDPKAVEFMAYNGIPHLLIPVVTDPKKAAGALNWAVGEMLKRYSMFSEYNVRNIHGYNALAAKDPEMDKMSQTVIFIDELADLIMASKNEVEDSICRLAQMARAAGMHLVIATQRPTVDVVTGLIKANIPSRIALKVSSGTDSRVIMDEQGAEKLLGKGDMLFKSVSMPKPTRVQGCWISDKEVERVVDFLKNKFELDYDDDVMKEVERQAELVKGNDKSAESSGFESGDIDVSDDKLEDAIRIVVENGQASVSTLQRKLKLGFGRAARLVDVMEEMGIVGPSQGSKPREVLMTKEQYYERQMNKQQ